MKIALVIERMEAWRGGAETSTLQYAHALRDAGCDVHLVTASRGQPPPGITLHMLPSRSFNRAWSTRSFLRQVRQLVLAQQFSVVHAVAPCPGANLYQPRSGTVMETIRRNLALCSPRRRLWKSVTGPFNLRQQMLLRLEKKMLAGDPGPLVVAISDYVARQLTEHYHFPAHRIRRVFNAVDPAQLAVSDEQHASDRKAIRSLYHLTDSDVVLLCVAHNFKLKGVSALLTAVAEVLRREPAAPLQMLIIGRDNPIPYLAQAERLQIVDRVKFVGSSERIPAFYHACDCLVHPTHYDPCSRVVLEALASGLPTITTRYNGAHEIMTDGVHGVVIDDAADTAALAGAVTRMLDPAFRSQCHTASAALLDVVSMSRHVRQMLEVYRELDRNGPAVSAICRGLGYSSPVLVAAGGSG